MGTDASATFALSPQSGQNQTYGVDSRFKLLALAEEVIE